MDPNDLPGYSLVEVLDRDENGMCNDLPTDPEDIPIHLYDDFVFFDENGDER